MKRNVKQFILPLLLVVITLFALRFLFTSRLLYSDDAELHAARIANYYLALKQGQILPRWAPNLYSGYGYPVFNFTYPLPYMISTLFYIVLPTTITMSLNLTIISLTVAGVLGVYFLARQFSLSAWRSALAAGLYLSAPYSLINIYSRTALGEIAFFSILPWVMWGVENFIRKKKVGWFVSLTLVLNLSLLIISHQTSIILVLPILIIYYWLRIRKKNKLITLIKQIVPIGIISVLLTSWYWLPALWEKKFIILDRADTITNYLTQFPAHWSFFFHKIINLDRLNTFMMTSIGYSSWIIFFSSLWLVIKKKSDKKIIWYLLGVMTLAVMLMMPFTRPLWLISGLGNYLQYPWRLLSILTLCTTLLFIHLSQIKWFKNNHWLAGGLIAISALSIFVYAQPRSFQTWTDYELFEYFKTTTTFNEFQPIWAAEYTRHFPEEKISFRAPGQKLYEDEIMKSIDGVDLNIQNWDGSLMTYDIDTDESVEVIQKTFFFPGWELSVDNQLQEIHYQDEEFPGHITYSLDPGNHQIQLSFTQNTFVRKIGSYLTLLGLIILILYHLPRKT
jgi:hypothetical protein